MFAIILPVIPEESHNFFFFGLAFVSFIFFINKESSKENEHRTRNLSANLWKFIRLVKHFCFCCALKILLFFFLFDRMIHSAKWNILIKYFVTEYIRMKIHFRDIAFSCMNRRRRKKKTLPTKIYFFFCLLVCYLSIFLCFIIRFEWNFAEIM